MFVSLNTPHSTGRPVSFPQRRMRCSGLCIFTSHRRAEALSCARGGTVSPSRCLPPAAAHFGLKGLAFRVELRSTKATGRNPTDAAWVSVQTSRKPQVTVASLVGGAPAPLWSLLLRDCRWLLLSCGSQAPGKGGGVHLRGGGCS